MEHDVYHESEDVFSQRFDSLTYEEQREAAKKTEGPIEICTVKWTEDFGHALQSFVGEVVPQLACGVDWNSPDPMESVRCVFGFA